MAAQTESDRKIESLAKALKEEAKKAKTAEDNFAYIEQQCTLQQEKIEGLKRKLQDKTEEYAQERKKRLDNDRIATVAHEETAEAAHKIDDLEIKVSKLERQLREANWAKEQEESRVRDRDAQFRTWSADTKGLNAVVSRTQRERDVAVEELTILRETVKELQFAKMDLDAEREITDSLRTQMDRMREDMQDNSFNVSTAAYSSSITGGGPSAGARPESNGEGEGKGKDKGNRPASVSSSGTPEGNSSGSRDSVASSNTTLRTSNFEEFVPVMPTKIGMEPVMLHVPNYIPYQTAHHNPITCWFTTDINFLLLFVHFVRKVWTIVTPIIRRIFRLPSISVSFDSAPAPKLVNVYAHSNGNTVLPNLKMASISSDAYSESSSADTGPSRSESNSSEATQRAPPILTEHFTPIDVHDENREQLPRASGPEPPSSPNSNPINTPPRAGVEDYFTSSVLPVEQTLYEKLTNLNITPSLPIKETLIWFLLHVALYFAIYYVWIANQERHIWLEVNDITRGYFHDLWRHRDHGRSFFLRLVSEDFARRFHGFVLAFVRIFSIEYESYPIPG